MARIKAYEKDCLKALAAARTNGECNKAFVVITDGLDRLNVAALDVKRYRREVNPAARVLVLCRTKPTMLQVMNRFDEIFGREYSFYVHAKYKQYQKNADFVFATVGVVENGLKVFEPDEFDYILVYELHHDIPTGRTSCLDYFRPKFVLGMSATLNSAGHVVFGGFFDEGPTYCLDFTEAMRQGLLCDIDYRVELDYDCWQDFSHIIEHPSCVTYAKIDNAIGYHLSVKKVAETIQQQMKKMDDPSVIIFYPERRPTKELRAYLEPEAAIVSYSFDGGLVHDEEIDRFQRDEVKIILFSDLRDGNVNIPPADLVVFWRAPQTDITFMQQLGCIARKNLGDEKVVVLDFVESSARLNNIIELERNTQGRLTLRLGECDENNVMKHELVKALEIAQRNMLDMSLDEMLAGLRNLNIRCAPSPAEVDKCNWLPSSDVYARKFGSFNTAIIKAKLELTSAIRATLTEEEMLCGLKVLADEIGHAPNAKQINHCPWTLNAHHYKERFGSYTNAFEMAGIEPVSAKD